MRIKLNLLFFLALVLITFGCQEKKNDPVKEVSLQDKIIGGTWVSSVPGFAIQFIFKPDSTLIYTSQHQALSSENIEGSYFIEGGDIIFVSYKDLDNEEMKWKLEMNDYGKLDASLLVDHVYSYITSLSKE